MIEIVGYGGRIDNFYDADVLNAYIKIYFDSLLFNKKGTELAAGIPLPSSNNINVIFDHISLFIYFYF